MGRQFARSGAVWGSTPGEVSREQPVEPDVLDGGDVVEGVGVVDWRRVLRV